MNRIDRLSKIAQDEFGITIKSKPSTGETFESLYGETTDIDRKEKQIEEIYEQIKYGTGSYSDDARSVAEILYNIGYRKQSEAVKEIFEEIDNIISNLRDSPFYSSSDAVYELTELKKKHTEESEND